MARESPQHELAKAIIDKWNASADLTGYFSGIWRDEALSADGSLPSIPYVVWKITSVRDLRTTEGELWRHDIEFESFNRTETNGATALQKLKGIFNNSPIVLNLENGHELFSCEVGDESNVQDDKAIWRAMLSATIRTTCPI